MPVASVLSFDFRPAPLPMPRGSIWYAMVFLGSLISVGIMRVSGSLRA